MVVKIGKRCNKCGTVKPHNEKYFYRRSDGKRGLNSICITCIGKLQSKNKHYVGAWGSLDTPEDFQYEWLGSDALYC